MKKKAEEQPTEILKAPDEFSPFVVMTDDEFLESSFDPVLTVSDVEAEVAKAFHTDIEASVVVVYELKRVYKRSSAHEMIYDRDKA